MRAMPPKTKSKTNHKKDAAEMIYINYMSH